MARISMRAVAVATVIACLPISHASAHCFVGNRFFPATLNVDDPCVADELSLPTVAAFRNGDDPSAREVDISAEISKRITENFGISVGDTWIHLKERGGATASGFDNLETSFKFQFVTDPTDEFVMSAALDVDWGGTGSSAIGAEPFTTFAPALFVGKGFGFLPEELKYLKPLAITGQVGYAIPTESTTIDDGETTFNPRSIAWGGSLQYSMPYLKSAVEDAGLPDFINRLIPLVEWNLSTETGRFAEGERTTGTLNPGIIYVGDKFQISGEAIIPVNRASGDAAGGIGQLHFYLDDIFPKTYGQPLFAASNQ
ncbi:hypothetical protein [Hyphomicrobium sp.]|uniref:hypothetical protein n=1 Tax=Hyphomicrobium sp. TaxID=82 RepID=UPI001D1E65AE|nr:hypothetical protein [Hyphomicrobium sp.]MBY0560268.1 hypothetical protein [Hyphomicrobium sp.]